MRKIIKKLFSAFNAGVLLIVNLPKNFVEMLGCMLKKIWCWLCSLWDKDVDSRNTYVRKFAQLLPYIDENPEKHKAFEALDEAIHDDRIKNFAITGPYGSGKSSLWETYKKHVSKVLDEDSVLEVSLAKFGDDVQKEYSESDIERGIIQQILFSSDGNNTPNSKISAIKETSNQMAWGVTIGLFCFTVLVACFFRYDYAQRLFNERIFGAFSAEKFLFIVGFMFLSYVFYRCALFIRKYRVCKFSFQSTEIEFVEKNGSSLISQYLAELMYFFEKNDQIRVVAFDDMDRLKDVFIFIKLRELNRILNNYPGIKHRGQPVKFLFMVKDDLFKGYERTKFFDFIIPIVSVFNEGNAADFIAKQKESNPVYKEYLNNIDSKYLMIIQRHLNDLRLFNNCVNEFIVYKSQNKAILQNTKLDQRIVDQKIFSMILYKNMYPGDFQLLLRGKGVLYSLMNESKENLDANDDLFVKRLNGAE